MNYITFKNTDIVPSIKPRRICSRLCISVHSMRHQGSVYPGAAIRCCLQVREKCDRTSQKNSILGLLLKECQATLTKFTGHMILLNCKSPPPPAHDLWSVHWWVSIPAATSVIGCSSKNLLKMSSKECPVTIRRIMFFIITPSIRNTMTHTLLTIS